ncbi:MAG: hypothetical protein AABW63_00570 [Nanoarchaeota archaeon]
MPTIQTLIGERFENIFSSAFTDFERTDKGSNGATPDFFNSEYGFWAEAKVGNKRFNAQLKEYQVKNFKSLGEPVLYVVGFHDFDNAHERLGDKSDSARRRVLAQHMNIVCLYWVSSVVVQGIYEREWRLNQKGTIKYCDLKQRFLEGIINDVSTIREGKQVNLVDYYGLRDKSLVIEPLKDTNAGFQQGVILDAQLDRLAINYLEDVKVL